MQAGLVVGTAGVQDMVGRQVGAAQLGGFGIGRQSGLGVPGIALEETDIVESGGQGDRVTRAPPDRQGLPVEGLRGVEAAELVEDLGQVLQALRRRAVMISEQLAVHRQRLAGQGQGGAELTFQAQRRAELLEHCRDRRMGLGKNLATDR